MVQWLRIRLPVQGMRVQSLGGELKMPHATGQLSFNFTAAVTICSDFGAPPKIKSVSFSTVSPSISHEVMGPDAMILVF